jgi:light-regulated signal transduction histidine kinase (bacteriophytochrome)
VEGKSSKIKNKIESTEEENSDYQKIIQESMQAISKLGFVNANLYKDIRLILNDLEENFKQKIANKEITEYKIAPEDIVAGYLKKIKS